MISSQAVAGAMSMHLKAIVILRASLYRPSDQWRPGDTRQQGWRSVDEIWPREASQVLRRLPFPEIVRRSGGRAAGRDALLGGRFRIKPIGDSPRPDDTPGEAVN